MTQPEAPVLDPHRPGPQGQPAPVLAGRHVLILNWRDEHHPEAGGSEVYVGQMARGFAERGAEVTMLCPRYPGAVRRETLDGVRYLRVGGRLSIYVLAPLLALVRRLPRHDVVVEIQNGMPFLASAYLRTPVTVVVHHVHKEQWPILFSPALARLGWWLESRVAPRVARRSPYVTVSEATRDELAGHGVRREAVTVIRNGSPRLPDIAVGPRSDTPEITVLGRLVPHKRVELAIDAVHTLRTRHPDLHLTVMGEGWWHQHLSERVAALDLGDAVTFTGHVSEDEKHRLLARAWVSALPSVKEGWGLAVVEAGLHETPVVAFRSAGGVRESLVDGETGLLAEDQDGFTEALGRLLSDTELRRQMGRAAQRHAASFTWEASQDAFATHLADQIRSSRVV